MQVVVPSSSGGRKNDQRPFCVIRTAFLAQGGVLPTCLQAASFECMQHAARSFVRAWAMSVTKRAGEWGVAPATRQNLVRVVKDWDATSQIRRSESPASSRPQHAATPLQVISILLQNAPGSSRAPSRGALCASPPRDEGRKSRSYSQSIPGPGHGPERLPNAVPAEMQYPVCRLPEKSCTSWPYSACQPSALHSSRLHNAVARSDFLVKTLRSAMSLSNSVMRASTNQNGHLSAGVCSIPRLAKKT